MLRKLNLLHRLHARLIEIVSTAAPLISSTLEEADLIGLEYLRDELFQTLCTYALYIDRFVIDRAERSADGEIIGRARSIRDGSKHLILIYEEFCRNWVHRDPMINWPEYRLSSMVFIKHIREQVSHSRDLLGMLNARACQMSAQPISENMLQQA